MTRSVHPKRFIYLYSNPDGTAHVATCPERKALAHYLNSDAAWAFQHAERARLRLASDV